MGTMRDALLKAGLISQQQRDRAEAVDVSRQRRETHAAMKRVLKERSANLDNLGTCTSVNEFRSMALQLLLEEANRITDVIRLAHQLPDTDGKKRLIWQLFQIRDELRRTPPQHQAVFLRRSLRKAGGLGSKKDRDR